MSLDRLFRSAVALVLVFTVSCGGTDATSPTPKPTPNPTPTPTQTVATVDIAPATATVNEGRTLTLNAVAKNAQGQAMTRTFTWTSSAPNIVMVSSTGVATGVAVGQASLTAAVDGKSAQVAVTVVQAPVAAVVIAPDSTLIRLAESAPLVASVRDEQGAPLTGRTVRWRSNNVAVATVDSLTGIVTAVDAGVAVISATSESKTGNARIVVFAPVATVSIEQALDTLEAFDTLQVTAVLRDAKGRLLTGRVVRWTSSNAAVATIESVSGRLAGIDRGTVTVTATSEGKSGTTSRVVVIKYRSIAAGGMHVCDIASGGIAWCWGLNGSEGRLGSGPLGTHANSAQPVAVPGGHRFTQLVTYARTTCGITRGGETLCWGHNGFNALGDGSPASFSATPVRVSGNRTFVKLAAGTDFACGLDVVGAVYCWGYNGWAQFGNNTTAQAATPTPAAPGMTFATIAAGSTHVCGIAASGTYCWGADGQGQVGDGAAPSNGNTFARVPKLVVGGQSFQSLALGNLFTCARTSVGQGFCWGSTTDGVLGSARSTNASAPVAIAGGLSFQSLSAGYEAQLGNGTTAPSSTVNANPSTVISQKPF